MKFVARFVLGLIVGSFFVSPAFGDGYDAKPKLAIVLVFDQFRGDYLDRYRSEFKTKNGWNLFLKQGAHFTDCYYDYANLVTAAGHATIGTGAYTDGHGIPLNEWYEPGPDGKMRQISSVADDRYKLVGAPAGTADLTGASPYREKATTLGDELVVATGGRSRVYGVSMKDRAAIMTSGHATNGAFWIDHDTGQWVTSTYWMKDLPQWAKDFNASDRAKSARAETGVAQGSFYEKVGRYGASVRYQLEFAQALIAAEKLGNNPAGATDLLTLSISSTDINGHAVGPDDPSQKALIVDSDRWLDAFFTFLDKTVGLKNVVVAMTGDHGVAISQNGGDAAHMPVLNFQAAAMTKPLEERLEKKYPPKKKVPYILQLDTPYLILNPQAFEAAGVSEAEAEETAKSMLEQIFAELAHNDFGTVNGRFRDPAMLAHVATITQMREGGLPDTQYSRLLAHSYSPYIGWGLHINFGPYQFPYHSPASATHFTANSYDRHVPLELYGAAFVPGTYHGMVAPVDIAATFASLLRINRPSAAVGRVLTEAMRPEGAGSTWVRDEAPARTAKK